MLFHFMFIHALPFTMNILQVKYFLQVKSTVKTIDVQIIFDQEIHQLDNVKQAILWVISCRPLLLLSAPMRK